MQQNTCKHVGPKMNCKEVGPKTEKSRILVARLPARTDTSQRIWIWKHYICDRIRIGLSAPFHRYPDIDQLTDHDYITGILYIKYRMDQSVDIATRRPVTVRAVL